METENKIRDFGKSKPENRSLQRVLTDRTPDLYDAAVADPRSNTAAALFPQQYI